MSMYNTFSAMGRVIAPAFHVNNNLSRFAVTPHPTTLNGTGPRDNYLHGTFAKAETFPIMGRPVFPFLAGVNMSRPK